MIGNDVVDLELAQRESNWKRRGFLNKLFTDSEQILIYESDSPEHMVWNLWSRKEAAYKIVNRQTGLRLFNPIQLECVTTNQIQNFDYGTVRFYNQFLYTRTEIKPELVYTEAVTQRSDFELITTVTNLKNIQKENGIPFYFDDVQSLLKPLSITHHGRFNKAITTR
jgi:phosphopantetheinyl transferase (holo-ACP synthase)